MSTERGPYPAAGQPDRERWTAPELSPSPAHC
jgi:hypothetical protein